STTNSFCGPMTSKPTKPNTSTSTRALPFPLPTDLTENPSSIRSASTASTTSGAKPSTAPAASNTRTSPLNASAASPSLPTAQSLPFSAVISSLTQCCFGSRSRPSSLRSLGTSNGCLPPVRLWLAFPLHRAQNPPDRARQLVPFACLNLQLTPPLGR